jgi:UrcA family protein
VEPEHCPVFFIDYGKVQGMEKIMTRSRIALFGSAMAVALCGAGVANAQDYRDAYYGGPTYRTYDDRVEPVTETVIVRPDYDVIEKQQLFGNVNGERDPQAYTISRPVNFSDLDLSFNGDRAELRSRIHEAASDMCAELDARVPGLVGDRSADRECVRNAMRNAMRDVMEGNG